MTAALILLTILLPWTGALLVWLVGYRKELNPAVARLQNGLASVFAVAAGLVALALIPSSTSSTVVSIPMGEFFGSLTFVPDGLGVFLAAIATVVGSLAVIFSIDYMRGDPQLGRYYFLVLFFIGGMAGLALTGSLLFLFIFWEITALCSYALISFFNDDPKAVAGGIKALIITQVGGVGLLLGALLAYTTTGSYEISAFMAQAPALPALLLSLTAFGFLIAAAAKSAQVPFQTWLPDAMEAPTPVSALIHAATMVNAGVYLLARFYPSFEGVPYWRLAVIITGAVTVLLAALMACVANDLKRVLAYSTVSQLGYMVYAVGAGSVFASQFHLFSHALFKALLFLGAGAIIHALGTRDMRQMGAQAVKMPIVRATFITGALALAGIPILNGFWSKEVVMEAGLEGGPFWAYLVILAGAGLTAFYTFRMVWMVFYAPGEAHLEPAAHNSHAAHDAPMAMRIPLLLLAFASFTSWLLAGPFSNLLAETLPMHEVEAETTLHMVVTVLTAPATWIALLVIAAGLAAWQFRRRLAGLGKSLGWLSRLAQDGFGFERVNSWVVDTTRSAADGLRPLQTGQLNWNLVGLVGGLILVLAWLAWTL
jgi:NADH-quinone oxidoreductase subunit L